MIYFTDHEIDNFLSEDLPFEDITTSFLKLENKPVKIQFTTHHNTVVCCTEEVRRIFSKLTIQTTLFTTSGEHIEKSVKFFEAEGLAKNIHAAWRVCENLMGFASGIATRTKLLTDKAASVNPGVMVCTTRKTFPGTRKIAVKSVLAGNGSVHRLGLSDTILIFKNHINLFENPKDMLHRISVSKPAAGDKCITVETASSEFAKTLINSGIKNIQLNRFPPAELKKLSKVLRKINAGINIIAAGGITDKNIEKYAQSGVNIIVTSWPYQGPPADFGVSITPL